jgi:hypothetical protein
MLANEGGNVTLERAEGEMRFCIHNLAVIAMLAAGFGSDAFAARGNVPTIDIRSTCKTAAGAMVRLMGSTSMERDIEICLGSEQSARDQLVKDWSSYSGRDRERCVRPGVYLPSYVEWLTCLEMERDARKMNLDQTDPGAPITLPIVRPGRLW